MGNKNKEKKKVSVIWRILRSLLTVALAFFLGIFLDSRLFTGSDGVKGHGMPLLTILLPILTAAVIVLKLMIDLIRYIVNKNKE